MRVSSDFNWGPGLFILGYHALLLVALPLYLLSHSIPWGFVALSFAMVYITGMSVTAGYHRFYSHTTYKMNRYVEAVLLFFATMATQGSALRWAYEHRCHHAFVDTDQDPYSIKKGFWYAHFLWLFEKPKPIEDKVIADLLRNPLLRLQDRFYPLWMVASNLLVTLAIGAISGAYLEAFLFSWLMRLFFLHHFTWFINSLAHPWGTRDFCRELSAVDNYLISLVTFGEGYHNYHHTFAYDYRNGIRWYHFDPTKWLIWTLSKLGLAHKLRRVQPLCIEEKLLTDRKRLLLQRVQNSLVASKEEWEERVNNLTDSLLAQWQQLGQLMEKKSATKGECLDDLRRQIKEIKKSLNQECRRWVALAQQVDGLPN